MNPQTPPADTSQTFSALADPAHAAALADAYQQAVPEIVLLGVAGLLFLIGVFVRGRGVALTVAVVALVAAGAVAALVPTPAIAAGKLVVVPLAGDGVADFVRWLALGCGLAFALVATKELSSETAADYLACLLVVVAGTSLVARSNDLITLYLSLELISIPTYVLLYLPKQTPASQEAAAKYFLLSVLSGGVTLFGFSYLFGLTGSTNLSAMASVLTLAHRDGPVLLVSLAAVFAIGGLAFRIAAVPFHFYAPDVYQGGPTGVIAQLAVVPKVAGFVAIGKLVGPFLPVGAGLSFPAATYVPILVLILAGLSMTLGNLFALVQDDLKRLLAYSGVAHAGYMLLAMTAATGGSGLRTAAAEAVLFYLVAYALMTTAVFAAIVYLHRPDRPAETVDDLAGVGTAHPVVGFCLSVALLSLIGIPLFAGFYGKLFAFLAAYRIPDDALGYWPKVAVVIAAVNAAIGAVYYLRLLGVMYLRSPLKPPAPATGIGPIIVLILCTLGTLALGVYPQPLAAAVHFAVTGK